MIVETSMVTIISTPKRKSWVLIIFLALITLQFTNGLIQSLFFAHDIPLVGRIAICMLSLVVVYFALKGLLWQIKGVREIQIRNNELKISKLSPLWKKSKTYKLSEIKSLDIRDETVSEGPIAMLQLLNITDKVKIIFSYGFQTIVATSGIDRIEADELKKLILKKWN